jgi:Spy/CpxP family protein refolding chaperone
MKKIVLTLAIAVSAFTASYAQKSARGPITPEQRAERSASQLKEKLALTDAQKAEVYKIEVDKFKKQDEVRKERLQEMKKVAESRKSEMKDSEDKLAKVLTPEQKAKYEAMKAERKDKIKDRQHRKGRNPGQARPSTSQENS